MENSRFFNGLMVLPNIVGLLILSPQVVAILRDYEKKLPKEIGCIFVLLIFF